MSVLLASDVCLCVSMPFIALPGRLFPSPWKGRGSGVRSLVAAISPVRALSFFYRARVGFDSNLPLLVFVFVEFCLLVETNKLKKKAFVVVGLINLKLFLLLYGKSGSVQEKKKENKKSHEDTQQETFGRWCRFWCCCLPLAWAYDTAPVVLLVGSSVPVDAR